MRSLFRRLSEAFYTDPAAPLTRYRPEPGHPVHVQIVGRHSIDLLTARDISLNGLGVYVPHQFLGCDIDTDVDLVITLPGERAFSARGRIRHRTAIGGSNPHFGVEITLISKAHRSLIERYLASGQARPIERKLYDRVEAPHPA